MQAKNGQAAYSLLRLELEREAELQAARLAKDREVVELEMWANRAKEDLEQSLAEREQVERQLEQLRAGLVAARENEQVLLELLRDADRVGLLQRVLPQLDYEWVDENDVATT